MSAVQKRKIRVLYWLSSSYHLGAGSYRSLLDTVDALASTEYVIAMIVVRTRPPVSLTPGGDVTFREWHDNPSRHGWRTAYNKIISRIGRLGLHLPASVRRSIFRTKLRRFEELVAEFRPDVIHLSQQLERDFVLLEKSVQKQLPVVQHFRGRPSPMLNPQDIDFFNRHNIRGIVTSKFNRNQWIEAGLKPELLSLVYPFVAMVKREKAPNSVTRDGSEKKLLFVGRLMREKAPDLVIKSFAQSELVGWRLQLLGQGPLRGELDRLVRDIGLENKVDFISHSDTPGVYYDAAEIVILPNFREVFGRTTVEAMMHGKAVMTSNTGGSIELIEDSKNGVRVASADPRDWAFKIRELQNDENFRRRIGAQAAAFSRRFNSKIFHASEIEKIYNTLLDGDQLP